MTSWAWRPRVLCWRRSGPRGSASRPRPSWRRVSPLAQMRAFRALVALLRRERPDLVHGHMPISGFLARLAAVVAGVPRVAYTCHGFLFNQPGPWPRRAVSLAMEWLGGRMTDVFLTVSDEEAADARRLGIARGAVSVRNGRDPALFRPDPPRAYASAPAWACRRAGW
ncbi:MAG: glycosyltransferase [Acetobacteraceae bacterium]